MRKSDYRKVLVVDKPGSELDKTASALEEAGYVVIKACSGTLAINLLECNPDIQLIITDTHLPDFPGKELIKKLRSIPVYKNTPSIIVSEKIALHEIDELLELGASYFLPKPLQMDSLFEYIGKLLRIK